MNASGRVYFKRTGLVEAVQEQLHCQIVNSLKQIRERSVKFMLDF